MNCPECQSTKIQKNGKKRGKQNHRCVQCGRQFITEYNQYQGYSNEFKNECLKLYVNGMGFRAIERVSGSLQASRRLARLHRKTLCYSKSLEMLGYSIRFLVHYPFVEHKHL